MCWQRDFAALCGLGVERGSDLSGVEISNAPPRKSGNALPTEIPSLLVTPTTRNKRLEVTEHLFAIPEMPWGIINKKKFFLLVNICVKKWLFFPKIAIFYH